MNNNAWIIPQWPCPPHVKSLISTRQGGVSEGAYASLNMGLHVGDKAENVHENRKILEEQAAKMGRVGEDLHILWLEQVHGVTVIGAGIPVQTDLPPVGDAAFTNKAGIACAVMTADCLPVLFCNEAGTCVAAAHAGWRGLLAGVLEKTVQTMACSGAQLSVYLGPAIGPNTFEVGEEVHKAFIDQDKESSCAFTASAPGKWLADIYSLARLRLHKQGIEKIYGGHYCTFEEKSRFFSYRRDGTTGRMVSMIWMDQKN